MKIQGVGNGIQQCIWRSELPIALPRGDGTASLERYSAPTVANSDIPALLGLRSLIDHRAVIDVSNKKLYLCGPGDVRIDVPPGSQSFSLEQSPSGHLMLPVSDFHTIKKPTDRLAPPPAVALPAVEAPAASPTEVKPEPTVPPEKAPSLDPATVGPAADPSQVSVHFEH